MKANRTQKVLSIILSIALVLSSVPCAAFATEDGLEVIGDAIELSAASIDEGEAEAEALEDERGTAPQGYVFELSPSAAPNPDEIDAVAHAVSADEDGVDEVELSEQATLEEQGTAPEVGETTVSETPADEAAVSTVAEDDPAVEEGEEEAFGETVGEVAEEIVEEVSAESVVEVEREADSGQEPVAEDGEELGAPLDAEPAAELDSTDQAPEADEPAVVEEAEAPEADEPAVVEEAEAPEAPEANEETLVEESAPSAETAPVVEEPVEEQEGQEVTAQEPEQLEALEDEEPVLTAQASGTCGSSLKWSISGTTLTITGTGSMTEYDSNTSAPWSSYASTIKTVNMKGGTSIGKAAFYQCTALTSVTLPSTLTSIGEAAFMGCSSLTSVTLPSSVKTLGTAAFYQCSNLKKVSGGSYTALPDYVFGMTAIESFQIPKAVTSVSSIAFFSGALSGLTVASGNSTYSAKNGVLFANGGKTLVLYPCCKDDSSYTVPSGVTKLEESSFLRAQYLRSVTLSDSVKESGYFVFSGSALESVTFGKGAKTTSYQMFLDCIQLASINFGGLTELDAQCFAGCTSLQQLTLPKTVTSIGVGCFANCSSLVSFSAPGLKEVGFQCFLNDSSLKTLSLPAVVKIYRAAFLGCWSLESFRLPNTCTFVHEYAFEEGVKLTSSRQGVAPYGANGYRLVDAVSIKRTERYDYAFEVLRLVNKERAAQGLGALKMNKSLLDTAMARAGETVALFSHTRTDGSICFSANSLMTAENIAYGQTSPADAMNSWMNSEGHRQNILSSSAKTIGVGVVEYGGSLYWVQCFGSGSDTSNCAQPSNKTATQRLSLAVGTFEEGSSDRSGANLFNTPETYNYALKISLAGSVPVGQSKQAKVTLTNPGTGMTLTPVQSGITWSSNNTGIAKVSSGGKVTGVANGAATISAKLSASTLSKKVSVGVGNSLKNATVSSIANQTKTGKAITPTPTVKLGNKTLVRGTDYTLTYKNNVKSGTASIVITGKGSYTGSKTVTFNIVGGKGAWKSQGSRWWYRWEGGGYPTSTFVKIDGKTYRFDASGYMVTGWQKVGGSWYWFATSGAMATGWKKVSGSWYWFASNGKMVTGWKTISGARYYFKSSGAMATGWQGIGGKWYYFASSGAMVKSAWVGNYYLQADGVMATNTWIGKYHVNASGKWDKTR